MNKLTKQQAWDLLAAYTETPALQRHALQVAAAMEHFARLAGEDPEVWWAAGLLHDLDYEKYPEEHCRKAEQIMRERGVDEVYIRAMLCHGYGPCTDTKPESPLEKTLYTIDELTGLINAVCLVRPSKRVLDLEVTSVTKKFKDKAFAAGVNREVIRKGSGMLDVPRDETLRETVEVMKEHAGEIGLAGGAET